jgi:uncharacterized protein
MSSKFLIIIISLLLVLLIDSYVFQSVRTVFSEHSLPKKRLVYTFFWLISALVISAILVFQLAPSGKLPTYIRGFLATGVFMVTFSKLFVVVFLLIDDSGRVLKWFYSLIAKPEPPVDLSRSDFLAKAGMVTATVPLVAMTYGIVSGAHDYHVHRVRLRVPQLPKAFDGIRIAQLSDIHSGSFFSKTAVKGGIEMLTREKADLIFFTGDLVNNKADEMIGWTEVFDKVKAPLGVYSILGNHDYGDYAYWSSPEAKAANLNDLKAAHKAMGWNLLINEHKYLTLEGERLALIGVENWSAKGRFPKYGNLKAAHSQTEADYKILLSHDPSHWRAEVLTGFQDIDLTLSGHTHGMQFGIEIGDFKWSPVQYMYPEWAGLYAEGKQNLYVNRGYGYIGFPGRIGIPPEITIIELSRSAS